MAGKHASDDNSQFYRDLLTFGLRWLLGAVIVFGGAWFLTTQVFGGDDEPDTSLPDIVAATSTTGVTPIDAPGSTAAAVTTVVVTPAPSSPPDSASPDSTPAASTTTVAATTTSPPTTLGPELPPSELTARVLNSTSRNGLAAVVTDQLAALGYVMRQQDNYGTPLSTTTVFYVAGLDREAATLAGELAGDTTTAPNPAPDPSAELLVVLGSSFP